ncbi:flagellar motor switch protein FliN [Lysinibacillus sp. BF-4]|uniref:flagellar motor switch phosphatase FliY n=1 Tax=Lysinibacillus sp. BF-4 TaxID=1473546 RepID=UPI0005052455|nr:flagellar motor switch phosphatase FliY [Lysinibacillus sp. BF-4]KFL44345.1 flagellar motor switch protein FliN [Lysinibacillus sp. BF-4]
MSDEMISQEEIDALLRGESLADKEPVNEATADDEVRVEDYLNEMEQDALGEIGNISFGSSATALSSLLGQKVDITTPSISMINRNKLEEEFPHPYVAVQVEYTIGLLGMNLLVIKQSDAAIIADLMLGGDGLNPNEELGEIQLSAVQEAMNQMMGSAATSMSAIFNKKVDISPPSIDLMNITKKEGEENIPEDDLLVKVSFRLRIGTLIDSNIMQLLPLRFSKNIVDSLLNGGAEEEEVVPTPEPVAPTPAPSLEKEPVAPVAPQQQQAVPQQQPQMQQAPPMQQQYQQPMYDPMQQQYQQPMYQQQPQMQQAPPVNVQPAQFASFESTNLGQNENRNLNMLLDIPLQVTVELGRTKRSVKEILELSGGSIIELDKLAGEPVDILVNSRLIATGEVVVIDENFGVRITDVLSQAERINHLR